MLCVDLNDIDFYGQFDLRLHTELSTGLPYFYSIFYLHTYQFQ